MDAAANAWPTPSSEGFVAPNKTPGNLCAAAASNGGANPRPLIGTGVVVKGRTSMSVVKFAGAFAALLLASGIAAAQGAKPNDAQIAHIAYTAGQLDIQAAEQALQKSKNKDVLAFAADMERDHRAVNEKALALVKKLGVTPEDNDTSKSLSKQAADKRAELAKLNGKEFDKAYIDNEVAYHK